MLQCRSRRWCGGSWAKKEFASSRSIGRIDSPRERILKTRRRHGRGEETVGYRVPWRGTKFEISSGGLPRAANFSFNSLPHKESRLPDPKGEKSRKRLESRCRAGQSSRNQLPRGGRVPSGASGSPVPPSRLFQIPGRLDWFLYTLNRVYRKLFLDRWTFRMFIIHARYILSRKRIFCIMVIRLLEER